MEVNENIWGEPLAYFTYFNARTGATDLDDPDFTNYPPFTYSNINDSWTDPSGTTYPYTIRAGIAAQKFEPNYNYPDYSIAYVGMQNSDLPQCNIVCIGQAPNTPSGTIEYKECFKSDPDSVLPIAFISNRAYRSYRAVSTYTQASREFRNPMAGSNQKRFYAPYTSDNPEQWNQRNISYDMAYWRSFGIRSIIGSIYIKYVDAALNETTGLPTNYNYQPVTLKYYKEQTAEWKEAHPIAAAFMRAIPRSNVDGTYSVMNLSDSFMPDLTVGIKINKEIVTSFTGDIPCISPAQMIAGENNGQMFLPIFGLPTAATSGEGGVIGQIGSTPSGGGMNTGVYPMFIGANCGEIHHGIGTSTYLRSCWITADGTGDLEWIMRGAAAYGLFFTDGSPLDYPIIYGAGNDLYRWVHPDMCLGTVEEGGVTRGNYTRGTKNPTNRNFDWKDSTENDFDPSHPPGLPNEYSTITEFNDISDVATLTRRYALTKTDVETLGHELWQISYDIINSIQNDEWNKYSAEILDTFLTNNPIDCIVSLEKYPMTIPKQAGPVTLKLGKAATSITCNITTATTQTYYFNPVPIQPCYGNSFLDYEPYTHFELYVPFCGTVDLNPRDILGRNLSVNLVVDFTTGTCVAYVLSDSLVIETINGKLSLSIPVTGVDSTTIASQITNGILNTRNARYQHEFSTLSKFATPAGILSNISNVFGSANTILQSETEARKAEYELTHQQAAPHIIGSASPVGSWAIDFRCRLLIYYPTGDVIDNSKATMKFDNEKFQAYAETIGFACAEPGTPATYRGLLQATSPRLENMTTNNGTRIATADELQMIQEALASGIIV